MPKDFDQAQSYLPPNFNNQFDSTQFEITYSGSLRQVLDAKAFDPSRLIVMREKESTQNSNGRWVRTYGFADGHAEVHSAPTQDGFADWEKERMVPSQ